MENDQEAIPSPEPAESGSIDELNMHDMIRGAHDKLKRLRGEVTEKIGEVVPADEPDTDEKKEAEIAAHLGRRKAQSEKIQNRLRFEVLTPDHLDCVRALYDKHLLSTEALLDWLNGDSTRISEEIQERGRMFNEFDPDEETLKVYRSINPAYLSVRQQMEQDMRESETGDSPHGRYLVAGFFDTKKTDVLRGYLSLRYPPRNPKMQRKYADSLHCALSDQKKIDNREMQFNRDWKIDQMAKEYRHMAEIDTINIDAGFSGASYLLLNQAIQKMRELGYPDPESMIYYRSHTMYRRGKPADAVNVQNFHSGRFFSSLGFTEMAKRSDVNDVMVRRVDGKFLIAQMQWEYGHKSFPKLMQRIAKQLHERHLDHIRFS